jgi:hypothetical protein
MTEAEWLEATDPNMVSFSEFLSEFLRDKGSGRKARLFAVACCNRAFELIPDYCKGVVEMAELVADDRANAEELYEESGQISEYQGLGFGRGLDAKECASWAAVMVSSKDHVHATAWNAREAIAIHRTEQNSGYIVEQWREAKSQIALLRDIFGNPFRPFLFDSSWLTSTVTALAQQMYDSRDFSAMPILADALQDAGCDSADILNHCRQPGEHTRGCWVVDQVTGRS